MRCIFFSPLSRCVFLVTVSSTARVLYVNHQKSKGRLKCIRLLLRHFPNLFAELGGVNKADNNIMRLEAVQLLSPEVSLALGLRF
jgi:hypothetical protein